MTPSGRIPVLRRHRREVDDMAPGGRSTIPKEIAGQVETGMPSGGSADCPSPSPSRRRLIWFPPEDGEAQPEVATRSLVVRDTDDRCEEDEGR